MINTLLTLLYFLIILSVIVVIHEFGHLISAKAFGVYCKEFAIGYGPKVFSTQKGETEYSIRAVPMGGFVSMAGEVGVDIDDIEPKRTLSGIAPLKRIVIMLSGIFLNLVFGVFLLVAFYLISGYKVTEPLAVVGTVLPDTPAETAGFKDGDKILKVVHADGFVVEPKTFSDMSVPSANLPGERIYTILRDGQEIDIAVTPAYSDGSYLIGIQSTSGEMVKIGFLEAVSLGFTKAGQLCFLIIGALVNLFRGVGLDNLSGPIGIYSATSEVMNAAASFREGVLYFVNLMATLSLNVGIFNLFPLPLFDGGRVVLIVAEMVIGKPVDKKLETILMLASLALVAALFLFVTIKDVSNFF
ncbi:MAG: M50 family metallopeptidase [Erysipelotrichaceae bacterium]|jgi:regulator of sigma E protease|nr:M50 family metallopeptidase [Erysipelotrichaceae bacterium]